MRTTIRREILIKKDGKRTLRKYEMTDDLVDNGKLIGKTKEEIIELLGQEDVSLDGSRWTYYLGFKPSLLGIDPDVLEIEFKDGKVSKCWTRET